LQEGTSHQTGSKTLAHIIPKRVNEQINKITVRSKKKGEKSIDIPYHIKVAKIAPTVPGAKGEKPAPNPVAMTM